MVSAQRLWIVCTLTDTTVIKTVHQGAEYIYAGFEGDRGLGKSCSESDANGMVGLMAPAGSWAPTPARPSPTKDPPSLPPEDFGLVHKAAWMPPEDLGVERGCCFSTKASAGPRRRVRRWSAPRADGIRTSAKRPSETQHCLKPATHPLPIFPI